MTEKNIFKTYETVLKIGRWLNEADPLRGWGAYYRFGIWYITYDYPYPMARGYWKYE